MQSGQLIEHREIAVPESVRDNPSLADTQVMLRHPTIPFISYPYEWCFAQLKDAALLHLDIMLEALKSDITLCDASAYNVQFIGSSPIFIDTLSFIGYQDGMFWTGQRQFMEEFVHPLLLASYGGIPFNDWYRGALFGLRGADLRQVIPLWRKLSFRYLNYIGFPLLAEAKRGRRPAKQQKSVSGHLPRNGFLFILKQLSAWIKSLPAPSYSSHWSDYTDTRHYTSNEVEQKKQFVGEIISDIRPECLLDVGCNTGEFSLLALGQGAGYAIGLESDHSTLSLAYTAGKAKQARFIPIHQNMLHPSSSAGWAGQECEGLRQRLHADFILALAVVHHLSISGNIPFARVISHLLELAPQAIIEWVPKTDPMVHALLANREDIFDSYTQDVLLSTVASHGRRVEREKTLSSGRVLYFITN